MAYRCVLAPSKECDGCEECKEYDESEYINKLETEYDWYKEEQYLESIESEELE